MSQETWNTQYPVVILDRSELQRYLSVAEVDRLTDEDLNDIATAMKQELEELGFFEFLAVVARHKLAQKEGATHGT